MIAVKSQPEIQIHCVGDEVVMQVKKITNLDNVKSEKISFPACHLEEVISALVDIRDSE
jgi:hypothetical protein